MTELPNLLSDYALMVCMARGGVIGGEGFAPFRCEQYFDWLMQCTRNKAVIMGRNTREVIGHPLPDRYNIIVTKTTDMFHDQWSCATDSFDSAMEQAEAYKSETLQNPVVFIGGVEIYKSALQHCDTMYIAHLDEQYESDIYFPEYSESDWYSAWSEQCPTNSKLTFSILRK